MKPNSIEDLYEEQKLKGFGHEAIDFEDSLQLYLSATSGRSTIYVIIDALDECSLQDRREILAGFVRLLQLPQLWIKIFVTSRDTSDISFVLSKHPNLSIRASHNKGDVAAFLDDEIDRRVRDGRLLRGDVSLVTRQRVKDHLTEGAQGMFLWASLQLDHLCNSLTAGELLHMLDELPDGLKETYRRILARIKTQPGFKTHLATNVLRFLAYSSEPVNALSLARAATRAIGSKRVSPEEIDVGTLLYCCQDMVVIDSELGVLRLLHFTAREFLQENFDAQSSHAWITSQCLQELLDASMVLETDSRAQSLAVLPDFKLHSAMHWPFHSRLGTRTNEYIILEEKFTANRAAHRLWIKLLKSLEKHHLANLQTLIGLLRAFPDASHSLFLSACFFGLSPILTNLLSDPTITRDRGISLSSNEDLLPYILWLTPSETAKPDSIEDFKIKFDQILNDCYVAGLLCAAAQGHADILRRLGGAVPLPHRDVMEDHKVLTFTLSCCFFFGVAGTHLDVMKWVVNSLKSLPGGTGDGMPYSHLPGGTIAVAAFLGRSEAIEYWLKGINWSQEAKLTEPKRLVNELYTVASMRNARATALLLDHTDVDPSREVYRDVFNGHAIFNDCMMPPLVAVVDTDDSSVIDLLLGRPEIQVNAPATKTDQTALTFAAYGDFAASAASLCKHKDININLRNRLGFSALEIAICEESVEVLKVLLQQNGIHVNERSTRFGETPLITATRQRKVEAVKILMRDDRVKRDLRDMDGLTALDIAIRMDHEPLIKVLKGEGNLEDEDTENDLDDEYMNGRSLIKYLSIYS